MVGLRYYGDPILRRRADEVLEITDEIRSLIKEMIDVVERIPATGVAAPQMGWSLRIFVGRLDYFDPLGQFCEGPLHVFINPKLSSPFKEFDVMEEGCLSLPGLRIPVRRPLGISVEALDQTGKLFRMQLQGYPARVVMHENDHLNGTLTIDRTDKKVRNQIEGELRAMRKRFEERA